MCEALQHVRLGAVGMGLIFGLLVYRCWEFKSQRDRVAAAVIFGVAVVLTSN